MCVQGSETEPTPFRLLDSCESPFCPFGVARQGGKTAPKAHEGSGWKWVAGDLAERSSAPNGGFRR